MLARVSVFAKLLLISGGLLIFYDYVARLCKLYFFWESGPIGWFLLLLGGICLCLNIIDAKQAGKSSATLEKFVVCLLLFVFAIKTILLGAFLFSDAFEAAQNYLKTDSRVSSELGSVSGVVLLSTGAISTVSNSEGESGEATLTIVAKGEREYRQYEVSLTMQPPVARWQVVAIAPVE